MGVVERFHRIYLGDKIIKQLEIDFSNKRCVFLLDSAILLKDIPNASIFDPEKKIEPAYLSFIDVHAFSCQEGEFYLNATVVEFEATSLNEIFTQFKLVLTGGFDNSSFINTLIITAQDFLLGTTSYK